MDSLEKCKFHSHSVSFLEFILSANHTERVKAVTEWPTPETHKQLQHFLVFANFYCKSDLPFSLLKERFSLALILTLPDPSQQFVVEVDASDTGVRAMLSQFSLSI